MANSNRALMDAATSPTTLPYALVESTDGYGSTPLTGRPIDEGSRRQLAVEAFAATRVICRTSNTVTSGVRNE